ncbi:MAG: hypothetical protein JO316_00855 [Abitibacteriaceae bacterium]|nr:hypothetical protein [Abditibacteriaceae bacterium]
MGLLDALLGQVQNAILNHTDEQNQNPTQAYNAAPLLGTIQNLFGQHEENLNSQFGNVQSSSQDPYGDPADQGGGFGNVRSASEDPYGDPADQQ